MKILTHDEIPEKFDAQAQLLQLSTNWGIFGFEDTNRARKMGYPTPDYCAIYAVEGDELLSKVEVIRIKYKTPRGNQIVSGITGVLTRRDKSRLGLARRLLEEVHSREKAAGMEYALLWTARNNKAHVLYSSMGYVDVFSPPIALRKIFGSLPKSNNLTLRVAAADDASLLQELHSKLTAKRLGFTDRHDNFWKVRFEFGFDKPDSLHIMLENGKPVGYLKIKDNESWISCGEVLTEDKKKGEAIDLLEEQAKGRWLALGNTFVSDSRNILQKRKYEFSDYPYGTLMALYLKEKRSEKELIDELGTADPRFACQVSDQF